MNGALHNSMRYGQIGQYTQGQYAKGVFLDDANRADMKLTEPNTLPTIIKNAFRNESFAAFRNPGTRANEAFTRVNSSLGINNRVNEYYRTAHMSVPPMNYASNVSYSTRAELPFVDNNRSNTRGPTQPVLPEDAPPEVTDAVANPVDDAKKAVSEMESVFPSTGEEVGANPPVDFNASPTGGTLDVNGQVEPSVEPQKSLVDTATEVVKDAVDKTEKFLIETFSGGKERFCDENWHNAAIAVLIVIVVVFIALSILSFSGIIVMCKKACKKGKQLPITRGGYDLRPRPNVRPRQFKGGSTNDDEEIF